MENPIFLLLNDDGIIFCSGKLYIFCLKMPEIGGFVIYALTALDCNLNSYLQQSLLGLFYRVW